MQHFKMIHDNNLPEMSVVSQFSEVTSIAYDNIHDLLEKQKAGSISKNDQFNFFGIVTFMKSNSAKMTMVTLVDSSCGEEGRLKCNVFNGQSDLNRVDACWEIGDIIRCHRFTINSFNNQAQGCCSEKISSWTRFKRADDGFEFLSNKNTTIDDNDRKHVSSLREWLKSNPNNPYLLEAGLSDKEILDFGLWKQEEYRTNSKLFNHYLPNAKFVQFSRLGEGYIDIICQVCAVCKDSKDYNFLLVWDGTQTKYAIHQEGDFKFDTKSDLNKELLYHQDIKNNLFQVFIFDEFVQLLNQITPGDYVMLRNLKVVKPNQSAADYLLKLPGDSEQAKTYKRSLLKLTDFKADTSHLTGFNEVVTIIESINLKGKELPVAFINEEAFLAEFKTNMYGMNDDTIDELASRNMNISPNKKAVSRKVPSTSKLTEAQKVDNLLDDDEEQYLTDDEESFKSTVSNKENLKKVGSPNESGRSLRSVSKTPNKTSTQTAKRTPSKRPLPQNCSTLQSQNVHTPHISRIVNDNDLSPMMTDDADTQHTSKQVSPSKRVKYYDNFETCLDIHQLDKRLVNFTYIAPYLMGDIENLNKLTSIPFFLSIEDLKKEIHSRSFMRAKVEAVVFDYAKFCPPFACIYVTCKKCQYINFAPFHYIGSKKPNMLKNMLEDYDTEIGDTQPGFVTDDQNMLKRQECSKNFSLRWLNTAEIGSITMDEGSTVPVMNYNCPRCSINCNCVSCTDTDTQETSDEVEVLCQTKLDFSLRFWLNLKDHTGSLVPCLIEGGALNRFLGGISAVEFFTIESKKQEVYRKFHSLFSPSNKFLFTIDSFRLRKSEEETSQNRPEFLYKIVLFQELHNVC